MEKFKILGVILAIALILLAIFWLKDYSPGSSSNKEIIKFESAADSNKGKITYTDDDYPFSFDYSSDLSKAYISEETGDILLFQTKDGKRGFQIFISEYEESKELTPALIKKEVSEIAMEDPQIALLDQGKKAVIFFTREGDLRNREVWFTYDGFLYQITAREDFDQELSGIMATWKFL